MFQPYLGQVGGDAVDAESAAVHTLVAADDGVRQLQLDQTVDFDAAAQTTADLQPLQPDRACRCSALHSDHRLVRGGAVQYRSHQ